MNLAGNNLPVFSKGELKLAKNNLPVFSEGKLHEPGGE